MNTQDNKTAKVSLNDRKEALVNKADKTAFDFVKLANVTDKIENKTISNVYKNCKNSVYIREITGRIGKRPLPTFNEFKEKMPIKANYSNWDGYKAFSKFNVKEVTAKKVASQNKKEAKK